MQEGLQARGWINITGGYPGEERGVIKGISSSYVPVQPQQEIPITFYYRDSQTADNNNSTRVVVDIVERWDYEKLSNNRYQVTTEAWLTGIKRDDKRGNVPCCSVPWPSRTIQVFNADDKIVWGPKETNTSLVETLMSGRVYLGKKTYLLKPQTATSNAEMACHYFNYTTYYYDPNKSPTDPNNAKYLDDMVMGVQFYNGLPEECDPPAFIGATQADDICENTVEACVKFGPCSCEGMALVFEYHFNGDTWDGAKAKGQTWQGPASPTSTNTICLPNLPPTNHTNEPIIMYWRAKYIPDTAEMPETDWAYGNFQMMFILAPHETVPDISPQECSKLMRGDLIGKYQAETCYNEYSCADTTVNLNSRNEDIEECKKVNGVV